MYDEIVIEDLILAKEFADEVGGIPVALEALDLLVELRRGWGFAWGGPGPALRAAGGGVSKAPSVRSPARQRQTAEAAAEDETAEAAAEDEPREGRAPALRIGEARPRFSEDEPRILVDERIVQKRQSRGA